MTHNKHVNRHIIVLGLIFISYFRTELRFHATDKSTKNIVHRDNVLK